MAGIDQLIVLMWFLPVVCFVVIPLFISCFGVLYAVFEAFRPVAGQEKHTVRTVSGSRAAA